MIDRLLKHTWYRLNAGYRQWLYIHRHTLSILALVAAIDIIIVLGVIIVGID